MEKKETDYIHISVLLDEAINGLNIKGDGIYVDATMGGAGHASAIIEKLDSGKLYCFEQDPYAYEKGSNRLSKISSNFEIFQTNFVNLKKELQEHDVFGVDGILYDLGVSSFQFDIPDRGFSYNYDALLDMRMNPNNPISAYDIVNNYSFNELKRIFFLYGEEKNSIQIARAIEKARIEKPISTTFELVDIIKKALPSKVLRQKGHPAKQVFQALRIAVNNELDVFEKSLNDALTMLKPHGRICVITFHSLEDRICKQIFKEHVEVNIPRGLPIKEEEIKREFRLVNNKVIIASDEELSKNHRSHSAKLRIIEKI